MVLLTGSFCGQSLVNVTTSLADPWPQSVLCISLPSTVTEISAAANPLVSQVTSIARSIPSFGKSMSRSFVISWSVESSVPSQTTLPRYETWNRQGAVVLRDSCTRLAGRGATVGVAIVACRWVRLWSGNNNSNNPTTTRAACISGDPLISERPQWCSRCAASYRYTSPPPPVLVHQRKEFR